MSPLSSGDFPEPGADTGSLLSSCRVFQQQLPGQRFHLVLFLLVRSGLGADSLVKGTKTNLVVDRGWSHSLPWHSVSRAWGYSETENMLYIHNSTSPPGKLFLFTPAAPPRSCGHTWDTAWHWLGCVQPQLAAVASSFPNGENLNSHTQCPKSCYLNKLEYFRSF